MRLYRGVILVLAIGLAFALVMPTARAWKNESYTTDINAPGFGTHDWIANKSLSLLPVNESQYIDDNLNYYYYGTELPDNPSPLFGDGYGDTTKHHVYYDAAGTSTDSSSADRAQAMYDLALAELKANNYQSASKYAGAMTHYIADVAVFGHVMSSTTPWGAETHHDDYEGYVQSHHSTFAGYISFDGALTQRTASNAALTLAHDTTFDDSGGGKTCVWMDASVTPPPQPVDAPLVINEMEFNPEGTDSGAEWVELYNPTTTAVNIAGYTLTNNDGNVVTLSGTVPAGGYYIYTFSSQWLDNENEGVTLKSGTTVIDSTPIKMDDYNDGRAWARVPNGKDTNSEADWRFVTSTKEAANPSTRAYDWADPAFVNRAGQSINLAVNLIADVLHSLSVEAGYSTATYVPPVNTTVPPSTNTTTNSTTNQTTVPPVNNTGGTGNQSNTGDDAGESGVGEGTSWALPVLLVVVIGVTLVLEVYRRTGRKRR
jgi:hypothetical protein